jgi:LmbE family N-acetylglucosaminyl deacetylase
MKKILAVGAHFDDVELAAAGTLNYLSKKGAKVFKITLTDNVTKSKELKLNVKFDSSKKSSHNACKILGVKEIQNQMIKKCNFLYYDTVLMQYLEKIIIDNKIDTVFTHYKEDVNKDHVACHEIATTAARHCQNIMTFQSNFYVVNKAFSPNFFVDISNNVDNKIKSLNCYDSEHNRKNSLFENTIDRNRVWGMSNGVKYAEAFLPIKFLQKG